MSDLLAQATAIIRSQFREVLFLDSDNIPTASLMPTDSPVPQAVLDGAENERDPWMRSAADGRREEIWGKPAGLWESCVPFLLSCTLLTPL